MGATPSSASDTGAQRTTFWVSFSDVDGCLSVDIVAADDNAAPENRWVGCNPGHGEVQIRRIRHDAGIPDHFKNRLLTKDEVDALNAGKAFH